MLDEYCRSLSDEAQLRIALRFGTMAIPIWENHFEKNPTILDEVNALVGDTNRIAGGLDRIDVAFPRRCVEKIERSLQAAKEKSPERPVPLMKSDATLVPMLATAMQPLTNKAWDATLPKSVRLSFTFAFNILLWILKKRRSPYNETHIYVAINQAADALMSEYIKGTEELNAILREYENEKRLENEDVNWETAPEVKAPDPLTQDDMYNKIIGYTPNKDACGRELAKEVLRQMKVEGKSFWDEMEEYYSGTSKTYGYKKELESYNLHEFDVIVGSFSNDIPMTENEMLDFVSGLSINDLRSSGFEI